MSCRFSHRLLLALVLTISRYTMAAQGLNISLPAECQSITSVQDIEAGAYYAIGAQGATSYLLMRGEVGGSQTAPRIAATALAEAPANVLSVSDALLLWEFVPTGDGFYTLRCAQTGESIALYKQKTEYITMQASKPMPFAVEEHGGAFRIVSQTITTKPYLEAADWGVGNSKTGFSLYALNGGDSEVVQLYRLATKFSQKQGVADTPAAGRSVILADAAAEEAYHAEGTLTALQTLLLGNAEVAPTEELTTLTAQLKADGTFTLQGKAGYLGADLQLSSVETSWRISNGHVMVADGAPRFLCYVPAQRCFAVMDDEAATAAQAVGVRFLSVGDKADSQLSADGTLRLTGAWSSLGLAGLDFGAAKALDLTTLSLPVAAIAFRNQPEARNMPIYVSEAERERVPATWDFVVASDGEHYHLTAPTQLRDACSLYIPYPFSVGADELSYTRQPFADGGWETLVLPFEADVPQGVLAEKLAEASIAQLTFSETDIIRRGEPVIFQSSTSGELVFVAQPGPVSTGEVGGDVFLGTFEPFAVGSEAERLFLLNADGTSFVLAAAGSGLSPFRAAIHIGGVAASLPLQHTATSIHDITLPHGSKIYTIDGRRAARLPQRGIFIVGGKKVVR